MTLPVWRGHFLLPQCFFAFRFFKSFLFLLCSCLSFGQVLFGQFLLICPKWFSVLRGKLREKHYILVKKVVVATILLQKYSGGNSFLVWTKNSLLYSKYPKGKTHHVHLSILVKTDTFAQNLDNFQEDTLPIPKKY